MEKKLKKSAHFGNVPLQLKFEFSKFFKKVLDFGVIYYRPKLLPFLSAPIDYFAMSINPKLILRIAKSKKLNLIRYGGEDYYS